MATVIGDYVADHSPFHHNMIPSSAIAYQQPASHEPRYRSSSSHSHDPLSCPPSSSPYRSRQGPTPTSSIPHGAHAVHSRDHDSSLVAERTKNHSDGASRFPTPPDSSSPSAVGLVEDRSHHHASPSYMASSYTSQPASDPSSISSTNTIVPVPNTTSQTIPSPASETEIQWDHSHHDSHSTSKDAASAQKVVHIEDLAHVQTLARMDMVGESGPGILNDPPLQDLKFEISAMPIGDIIEMVAALLTKITTTNDQQHDALNRNVAHQRQAQAQNDGSESHSSPFSTSVLAFHGKNVPAISIHSYLSRIHKYCPTTYEVFLSLLVYFDRMTERVNEMVVKHEETRKQDLGAGSSTSSAQDTTMQDGQPDDEEDEGLADSDDEGERPAKVASAETAPVDEPSSSTATYFVVDSFNIHRLIISGVTCASKFFSDVFYTNSRYAKVGGLPLAELNHLELQFLLLNDFRLAVPVEDLEAYATMLVEFYAREVVAQQDKE